MTPKGPRYTPKDVENTLRQETPLKWLQKTRGGRRNGRRSMGHAKGSGTGGHYYMKRAAGGGRWRSVR